MLWNKTKLKHMLLLNTTVLTTQAYLRLNHIPFRLIEENFACSRLRDGRVCESEKARTRNKTRKTAIAPFPRLRANTFACVSLTRNPYCLRAWNRSNRTVLVGKVAYIYYQSLYMKYDYLNASYWVVLSCRNAYFGEQGESQPRPQGAFPCPTSKGREKRGESNLGVCE